MVRLAHFRLVSLAGLLAFSPAQAQVITNVSTAAELATALYAAQQAGASQTNVISLTGNISATAQMMVNANVVINGGGFTIDMNNVDRAFFIAGGSVLINNLTIANGFARGGDGAGGGGGGAGLGGAIFVANLGGLANTGIASAANVTLNDVNFSGNQAVGGNGGVLTLGNAGGGGGMGGNGGLASTNAVFGFSYGGGGGGGLGIGANGGSASSGLNGAATFSPSPAGSDSSGEFSGGLYGGGGAGAPADTDAGGGGGIGGQNGQDQTLGAGGGGSGGFGGGGGGGFFDSSLGGGGGGFGGGGGSGPADADRDDGSLGGAGGFGGGGGFGFIEDNGGHPGDGGFGGGPGQGGGLPGDPGGGGGAGLGGAVFVMDGATLTVTSGTFTNNSVTPGQGGANGSAYGADLFLGADVTFNVATGQTVSLNSLGGAGNLADPNVANTSPYSGQLAQADGGVIKSGGGTLRLTGTNYYSGSTIVHAGVLELGSGASETGTTNVIIGQNPGDNGTMILGSGSRLAGGSLVLGQSSNSVGTLIFGAGNSAVVDFGTNPITTGSGAGTIVFSQSAAPNGSSSAYEFTSEINGNISILQAGTGTTRLAPGGVSLFNNFTGSVTIENGTLQIGNVAAIPNTAPLIVNGGALDLNGYDGYFSTIQLNGGAITNSGPGPVAFTANQIITANGQIHAAITGNEAGTFVLQQAGNGTTTIFSGESNILGGEVQATEGHLVIGTNAALLHIENLTATGNGAITFQGRNQSETQNASIGQVAGGASSLVIDGGALRVTSTTGLVLGSSGSLVFSGTGGVLDTAQIIAGTNGAGQIVFAQTDTRTMSIPFAQSLSVVQSGPGTTVMSGQITNGNTTVNAGTLQISTQEQWFNLSSQGTVQINGGTLDLGTPNVSMANLEMNGGTLTANPSAIAGVRSFTASSGTVNAYVIADTFLKTGAGTLTINSTNDFTRSSTVSGGTLAVNGTLLNDVTVQSGGTLGGSGMVGAISGAGAVGPGNSPGILTAPSVDASGGLSFNFEFTSLNPDFSDVSASVNDLLRLTSTTPFSFALTAGNVVNIYFNVASFGAGQVYTGGFFTDVASDFLGQIEDATFNYYLASASGAVTYNGISYSALGAGYSVDVSTVVQSANFAGGNVNGQISQFQVVPEPSTYALLALAAAGLGAHLIRGKQRRRAAKNKARPRPIAFGLIR
jgi:autotransporter-associated beta strand protein